MWIAYGACGVGGDAHYVVVTENFDADGDSVGNADDNCIVASNEDQADIDSDGVGDLCDVCPYVADPLQEYDTVWGSHCGFTSTWRGRTHTTPGQGTHFDYPEDESPDAWTLHDGCPTCDRSGADSTLTIPSRGRIYYDQDDPYFEFPDDSLVIEFRVKTGPVFLAHNDEVHTNVRFFDGEYGNLLSIHKDSLWLWSAVEVIDTIVTVARTANDYHSYRIVVVGNDIDVYVDFEHVLTGSMFNR